MTNRFAPGRLAALALLPAALACGSSTDEPAQVETGPTSVAQRVSGLPARPFGVAVSSAGVVLVTSQDDGRLRRFDGPTYAANGQVVFAGNVGDVAFDAAGSSAYAISVGTGTLAKIDVATTTVTASKTFSGSAYRVKLTPDGSTLLATSDGRISFLTPSTLATLGSASLAGVPNGLAISGDGKYAYVSTTGGTLYEVNIASRAVVRSVTLEGPLQDVVLSPNGNEVYVAREQLGSVTAQSVVVSRASFKASGTLPAPGFGMTLSAGGTLLYLTSPASGTVAVVDRAARTLVRTITVGPTPRRIAVNGSDVLVATESGELDVLR